MKVALVCIAKNEENYIYEWINYHLKIGFDHIFIYKNNWYYDIKHDKVTTIQFDGINMQTRAYGHFIDSNDEKYDWAAFFDVDEFLVLNKHENVKEFISDNVDANSIAINWVMFGDNNLSEVIDNNYSVLKRFTKRQKICDIHIKHICKLEKDLFFLTPHEINKVWKSPEGIAGTGPRNNRGSDSIAQLNHYYCKTRKEFEQKLKNGRADNDPRILPNNERNWLHFERYNKNEIEDLKILKHGK